MKTPLLPCLLTAAGLLTGCPSHPPDEAETPDLAAPDLLPAADLRREDGGGTEDVTGTAITTHVLGETERLVPQDLSKARIAALVPQGTGFTRLPGVGLADGNFRIAGVPAGPYYLQLAPGDGQGGQGTSYVLTSARRLDLGRARAGRPDVAVATKKTPLTFQLKGLNPYQDGDFIELFSPGAAAYIFGVEYFGEKNPEIGATEFKDLTIDYLDASAAGSPTLIDGDKGDRALLWQMVGRIGMGGLAYQALGKILRPASFVMGDGAALTIAGTFETVPQDRTVHLSWKRAAFEALRPSLVPGSPTAQTAAITLSAEPAGQQHGVTAGYADLVFGPGGSAGADVVSGPLAYGNPFPGSYAEVASASIASYAAYTMGTAKRMLRSAPLVAQVPKGDFDTSPIAPIVGPVRSPRAAGQDLFGATTVTGVGFTPRLSWEAPASGTAAGYVVTLLRLFTRTGQTTEEVVATFSTAGREVTLPDELLKMGETYYLRIEAVAGPAADLEGKPYRRGLPWGSATTLTRPFTP